MGRLELILGFRGCRREMDMKAEIIISIALRLLTKSNKNRYASYCLKAVPLFETVKGLKEYIVQRRGEELKPATTGEDFTLGYFGEGNKKFTFKSELQLAEALSLVKRGMVTLWADPHLPKPGKPQGHSSALAKKRKASSVPDDAEEDENSYEDRLSRLRASHELPEFKLRCWARMLVSNFEFPAFE
ncbi:unnamed protein product [Porites lobata]|uniref:Uncharacterized protein n=1 Tax=Porites lobata TaxID=104759 RepID=A0ABN8MQN1_9CNID|nr:unnamed protein product [Porites lobata]